MDKVHYLAMLAPDMMATVHTLVDAVLREEWWQATRTEEGLKALARLTDTDGAL